MNRNAVITNIELHIENQKLIIDNNGHRTELKPDDLITYRKHYIAQINIEEDSNLIIVGIPKYIASDIKLTAAVGGTMYTVSINSLDIPYGYAHSSSSHLDEEERANIVRKIAFDNKNEISKYIKEFDDKIEIYITKLR